METRIEKKGGDKYWFVTDNPRFKRTEEVDKKVLRELYEEGIGELNRYVEQLKTVNKDLEVMGIVEDDELKRFIELANRAAKYNEYQKKIGARDSILDFIDKLRRQKEDIEAVEPSFRRLKK
jgi:polyhydroxyalkanoate synthesis regulator phasin